MTARNAAAVILAAGKGVRMKSALPKVMHEMCGRPLLDYVVKAVKDAGVKRIIVVVGAQKELVKKAFKSAGVEFAHQKKQLGTGHAVLAARSLLKGFKGPVAVLCGDAPLITAATIKKALRHNAKSGSACTMITAVLENATGYGRIVRAADGTVERIVEEKDATDKERSIREVNSGNYVFDCDSLFEVLPKTKRANKQREYYLTDCVEMLKNKSRKVSTIHPIRPEEILGVNSKSELATVEQVYRRRV